MGGGTQKESKEISFGEKKEKRVNDTIVRKKVLLVRRGKTNGGQRKNVCKWRKSKGGEKEGGFNLLGKKQQCQTSSKGGPGSRKRKAG